jgi:tetratricopeptide (TPR) repeat protein
MSWGRGLAVLAAVVALAGCAGAGNTNRQTETPLEAAERACGRTADGKGDVAPCDRYVALAEQTGDYQEKHNAYSARSIFYEMRGDLDAATVDADNAIAVWPTSIYAQGWRAALMMEAGDYVKALDKFNALHTISDEPLFYSEMAILEYVVGDKSKAVELFQSAEAFLDGDRHDLKREAYFHFNAAIIESELRDGDLAPIRAIAADARTSAMVDMLRKHRLGELNDDYLVDLAARTPDQLADGMRCIGYFSIGHRNVVAGNTAAARPAFERTVENCKTHNFEYHVAKAWLKQLGT